MPCRKLRIGENLQDRPAIAIGFELVDGVQSTDILRQDPAVAQQAMEEYMAHKTGPMSR